MRQNSTAPQRDPARSAFLFNSKFLSNKKRPSKKRDETTPWYHPDFCTASVQTLNMRNVHCPSSPIRRFLNSCVQHTQLSSVQHTKTSLHSTSLPGAASIFQICSSSGNFKIHLNLKMFPASGIFSLSENELLLRHFQSLSVF